MIWQVMPSYAPVKRCPSRLKKVPIAWVMSATSCAPVPPMSCFSIRMRLDNGHVVRWYIDVRHLGWAHFHQDQSYAPTHLPTWSLFASSIKKKIYWPVLVLFVDKTVLGSCRRVKITRILFHKHFHSLREIEIFSVREYSAWLQHEFVNTQWLSPVTKRYYLHAFHLWDKAALWIQCHESVRSSPCTVYIRLFENHEYICIENSERIKVN